MNITILGSGFAALKAVQEVAKLSPQTHIQLIAPSDIFIYYPSLIWIPSGLKKAADLQVNLHNFFKRHKVTYIKAQVESISDNGRCVKTNAGEYRNDGLIIASGGRFLDNFNGMQHVFSPCKGIPAAEGIRDKLAALKTGTIAVGFTGNAKEESAMRGGPMFEFLFNIDALLRQQKRRDKFKLVFFNPKAEPAKRLGETAPKKLIERMQSMDIETRLGEKVLGFEERKVCLEKGELNAELIIFQTGLTGPAWLDNHPELKSEGGLIKADLNAKVTDLEYTYVAGDSGSFPGPAWQVKQGHSADLQAQSAAFNLLNELQNKPERKAVKFEIICILDGAKNGMFIKRTEKKSTLLPPFFAFHYAKRIFEYKYLKNLR